jgi:cytoplasmic iron level regulating protein YaaA (DUF328/UPF0246 family)
MLVIMPPSETKRPPPPAGECLDLGALSFPELNRTRRQVLAALIRTSGQPDAFERLRVRPTLVEDVLRNTVLHHVSTRPAAELYAGPLYTGFDYARLSRAAKARADSTVVLTSALWGLIRPSDPIPAYRLNVCASLDGMGRLEPLWRDVLNGLLARTASDSDVILDLRSGAYQSMGRPTGLADRTVTIRVLPEAGARTIGDVVAKRTRGEIARYLVEAASNPETPGELASAVDERWPARLEPPAGSTQPWRLSVRPAA